MDKATYDAITRSIKNSIIRFPNCTVASCSCDSKETAFNWEVGCGCPCHWAAMDVAFGEKGWTLTDSAHSALAGAPVCHLED